MDKAVLPVLAPFVTDQYCFDNTRNKWTSQDVCAFLSHLSPEVGYSDWWKVGSFLRNAGRVLFADSFQVFHTWSNQASADYKKKKAEGKKIVLKGSDIDPNWLRTFHWNNWNKNVFTVGTLRYIVKWSSKEGEEFAKKWGTHSVVTSIFENGVGRLTESDLARYMIQFTGGSYVGISNPMVNKSGRLFELGNGNIWRARTEISMAKEIEVVLRFQILAQCKSYNNQN